MALRKRIAALLPLVLLGGCMTYWEDTVGRPSHEFHRQLPLDLEACNRQYSRTGGAVVTAILSGSRGAPSKKWMDQCMARKGYRRVSKEEFERRN